MWCPAHTATDKSTHTATHSAASSLPAGWASGTDPTSGATYYYNQGAGVTQWDVPGPAPAPAYAAPWQAPVSCASAGHLASAAAAALPLPAGWTALQDTAGSVFYRHAMGQTTRAHPGCLATMG